MRKDDWWFVQSIGNKYCIDAIKHAVSLVQVNISKVDHRQLSSIPSILPHLLQILLSPLCQSQLFLHVVHLIRQSPEWFDWNNAMTKFRNGICIIHWNGEKYTIQNPIVSTQDLSQSSPPPSPPLLLRLLHSRQQFDFLRPHLSQQHSHLAGSLQVTI